MKLKCNKCLYEWEYTGNKTKTATCPDCFLKVKIPQGKEDDTTK